jgi:hypothetical protein
MRPDALYFTSLLVKGRELPLNDLKDFEIPGEGVIKRTDKFNHVNIFLVCNHVTKTHYVMIGRHVG